jgi:hypothetical protein
MIKIIPQGRTGNLLLQNIGLSIIAKRFNLSVQNYNYVENSNEVGLNLFSGNIKNENLKKIYDTDLLDILEMDYIDSGIIYDGTFQVEKFVSKFKDEILSHFELKYEPRNNEVFVHVRLGDVEHLNPGLEYYEKALSGLDFDSGFISSDTYNHPTVQTLMKKYKLSFYNNSALKTINFAKDFENLVLSKGTFSWWMGFLNKSENIIYPINDKKWYGDIFVFDNWKPIDISNI